MAAADPSDHGPIPRRPVRRLGLAALFLVVTAGLVHHAGSSWIDGEVTAKRLHRSVERNASSAGSLFDHPGGCVRAGRAWRCEVMESGGSGSATYAVTVDGSCWTGEIRLRAGEPMPDRAAGCVRLWEPLDPIALLLGREPRRGGAPVPLPGPPI